MRLGAGNMLTVFDPIDTTNAGGTPAGADITLSADQMSLNAAVNGGTGGIVTLAPVSAGQIINLGGADAPGRLASRTRNWTK